MSFNSDFPYTGITREGDLYKGLRDNFNAINDRFVLTPFDVSISPEWFLWSPWSIQFYKDPFGFVILEGIVSAIGTPASACFILPAGYRPDAELTFPSRARVGTSRYNLIIKMNGSVEPSVFVSSLSVDLSGISFYAG
jgi:hypothetical protein